jgi:hypothetical protein
MTEAPMSTSLTMMAICVKPFWSLWRTLLFLPPASAGRQTL